MLDATIVVTSTDPGRKNDGVQRAQPQVEKGNGQPLWLTPWRLAIVASHGSSG